jgi:hypothetical protein
MLKELLGIFGISVGNFMRNGCHVGLVGANPTWLKTKLHTCLKSRIQRLACIADHDVNFGILHYTTPSCRGVVYSHSFSHRLSHMGIISEGVQYTPVVQSDSRED